jgi:AcrR family transcriptional regulator
MGVSKQQAVENRRAIIAASEKLFREHGIDGVGLSALMKAAGFSQGSTDVRFGPCQRRSPPKRSRS